MSKSDRRAPGSKDVPDRRDSRRARAAKRKRTARRRRIAATAAAVCAFLLLGTVGVVYAATDVLPPEQVKTSQSSIIYYADGKTVMTKIGAQNRTDIPLSEVPEPVQHAVLAAENRDFYDDSGISPKGIARALWADVRGEDIQGGSTITQQYAKNAYLTQERTLSRKFKELILAVKLDRRYSKDQILEWYLNTIYYGRGAYGIQAAAEAYFGVPAKKLTLEQGAVLASSIRSPALYDPQDHREAAEARWHYVIGGMVEMGWLDKSQADQLKYPKVLPPHDTGFNDLNGPKGYIVKRVEEELAKQGISEAQLRRGGLRVVTTIDKHAQDAAVRAVKDVFHDQPKGLRQALVAVEPGSGKVRAYYGGDHGYGYFDYAASSYQPGSSMKVYSLATALERGVSVKSYWDGSSPQTFPDRPGKPVYNSGDGRGEQCPHCPLWKATAESLNTVYYALTDQVGAKNVARLAKKAGIRTLDRTPVSEYLPHVTNNIGLGSFTITPLDQANGFATFAAEGMHHDAYFVERVTRADNDSIIYTHPKSAGERAFSADTAADADWVLQKVITREPRGSRYDRRLEGPDGESRPAAAKTGTTQLTEGRDNLANKDAWFAGYTPQLAAAVWVGHDKAEPLVDASGRSVYGIYLPGLVWHEFMQEALADQPVQQFPSPVFGGSRTKGNGAPPPPPSPSPEPSESASPTPSPEPSQSEEPEPKPTESETSKKPKKPRPRHSSTSPTPTPTPTDRKSQDTSDGSGQSGNSLAVGPLASIG